MERNSRWLHHVVGWWVLLAFELRGADRNCTLLFYWKLNKLVLAGTWNYSVSSTSICDPSTLPEYVDFPLYLQCPWMAAVRLIAVQPHSGPTLPTFILIATKPVLVTDFWTKKDLNHSRCPRHVQLTLQLTNKHSQTPKHGVTKRQADRPRTESLRNKRTHMALNLM